MAQGANARDWPLDPVMEHRREERGIGSLCIVAYSFPPLREPESALVAKLASALNAAGSDVHVVTLDPETVRTPRDPSLLGILSPGVKVHRFAGIQDRPWRRAVQKYLPTLVQMPDRFVANQRRAVRFVSRLLNRLERPVLMSWAQYHSASLVCLGVKRHRAVPWVAHWSDPWVDNPYSRLPTWARAVNERMERRVMEHVDANVFVSRHIAELYEAKYRPLLATRVRPWPKTWVIPHCFADRLYPNESAKPPAPQDPGEGGESRLIVRYLGYFYGDRTPLPLFRALAELSRREPDLQKRLVVEFVGPDEDQITGDRERAELSSNLVRCSPPVPYVDSLRLMRKAHLLLVIDAPGKTSVFLPSKLIDYLGADRPILAITPPGAAAEVVERAVGWVCDPADPRAITAALSEALAAFRSNELRVRGSQDNIPSCYSCTATAGQYAHVFAELIC